MAKKPEGTNFDKLLEELNGKKNERTSLPRFRKNPAL